MIAVVGAVNCTTGKPSSGTRPRGLDPPAVSSYCDFRERLCGHEHRPVCALGRDGRWETYLNACEACRDFAVSGYRDGRCK